MRVAILLLLVLGALGGTAAERPNIVIIVADDLGFRDVSFHGGDIRTPHIDRLAAEGVQLDRFYVAPVCSPTRAGLLTGRYPIRYGLMRAVIPPWRDFGLDVEEVTLADALGRAGYTHRGVFGKWHLGHASVKFHPLRRGFTEFVGHYNGAIDYFTHEREGEVDWHHGYDSRDEEGYSTDLIAAHAAAFIRRRAAGPDPFFCYVPFNSPHSPFQAKPEDMAPYRTLSIVPGDWGGKDDARLKNRRILAGMVAGLDNGVGQVLKAIDEAGVRDNTFVLFFSDNGGVGGIGDNQPLRGAKADVFEGGIRAAAAARWPGVIPAGGKVDAPLVNVDVFPTVMRIAGLESHGGKPFDGIDVLDALTGKRPRLDRDVYSYIGQQGEDQEKIACITPEWKLVVEGPNIIEPRADPSKREVFLFRIDEDPNEKTNLAARHPDVVKQLYQKVVAFRALQPAGAVPPYGEGSQGFKAPPRWEFPDR